MKNIKLTGEQLEKIKKIAKGGLKLVMCGFGAAMYYNLKLDSNDNTRVIYGNASYSDAINAIIESDMFDSNKTKLITNLKTDADSSKYTAVISIVNSDMFDSNKVNSVLEICGKEES